MILTLSRHGKIFAILLRRFKAFVSRFFSLGLIFSSNCLHFCCSFITSHLLSLRPQPHSLDKAYDFFQSLFVLSTRGPITLKNVGRSQHVSSLKLRPIVCVFASIYACVASPAYAHPWLSLYKLTSCIIRGVISITYYKSAASPSPLCSNSLF